VLGCDRHAKNTSTTYLKRAESLGARVWPLCEVVRIASTEGGHEVISPARRGRGSNEAEATTEARTERIVARSVFLPPAA
jgi:hypothetical protein